MLSCRLLHEQKCFSTCGLNLPDLTDKRRNNFKDIPTAGFSEETAVL